VRVWLIILGIIRIGIQFICDQNCRAEATTYMLSLFAVGWSLGQRFVGLKPRPTSLKKDTSLCLGLCLMLGTLRKTD
jgi:hypothetical protein